MVDVFCMPDVRAGFGGFVSALVLLSLYSSTFPTFMVDLSCMPGLRARFDGFVCARMLLQQVELQARV